MTIIRDVATAPKANAVHMRLATHDDVDAIKVVVDENVAL